MKLKGFILIKRLNDAFELASDMAVARTIRGCGIELFECLNERRDAARADELEVLQIEYNLLGRRVCFVGLNELGELLAQGFGGTEVEPPVHGYHDHIARFPNLGFHLVYRALSSLPVRTSSLMIRYVSHGIKRQVLPPGLWVVATPIGNLSDFSPRGQQALEQADAILCEDTRRTLTLLQALGIEGKRTFRLDAHAGESQLKEVIQRLRDGQSFALVTDAGTPAISDPGSALVKRAHEAKVRVTPIPGASALMCLLSVAGFAETEFQFGGFFPRKEGDRRRLLESFKGRGVRVGVWFESPERLVDSLDLVSEVLVDSEVVAAKELTKLHERVFAGLSGDVRSQVKQEIESEGARGEWCFAIRLLAQESSGTSSGSESSDWVKALHCLLNAQVSASRAAREVSQAFGMPKNLVYEAALRISGKKRGEGG